MYFIVRSLSGFMLLYLPYESRDCDCLFIARVHIFVIFELVDLPILKYKCVSCS